MVNIGNGNSTSKLLYSNCESLTFFDYFHGEIKFEDPTKHIYSSKPVQRLNNIKQLGFITLIQPSASHSRLTHSVA
ncbi:MAG: hypothetical protein MHPSP_004383, partial [Paramarteilia canceri]